MNEGLGLDAWWGEPAYRPCNTLRLRGLFIFRKLREHDPAKFQDVMTDLYRDDQPDLKAGRVNSPDTIDPGTFINRLQRR